ncbi:hypothetical protein LguiB_006636 [Lonicera macranthoides]
MKLKLDKLRYIRGITTSLSSLLTHRRCRNLSNSSTVGKYNFSVSMFPNLPKSLMIDSTSASHHSQSGSTLMLNSFKLESFDSVSVGIIDLSTPLILSSWQSANLYKENFKLSS